MDIIKVGDLAVIYTSKELCFVIEDRIYGSFPKTEKMVTLFQSLLRSPENEQIIIDMEKEMKLFEKERMMLNI